MELSFNPDQFVTLHTIAKSIGPEILFEDKPLIIHKSFGVVKVYKIEVSDKSLTCKGHLSDGTEKLIIFSPHYLGLFNDISELATSLGGMYKPPTLNEVTTVVPKERNQCIVIPAKISDPQLKALSISYPLVLEKIFLASKLSGDAEEKIKEASGILKLILVRGAAAIYKPEIKPSEFYDMYLNELSLANSENTNISDDRLIEFVRNIINTVHKKREELVTKEGPYDREKLLHYAVGTFMLRKLSNVFSLIGGKHGGPIISPGSGREPFRAIALQLLVDLKLNER